jgi:hypothetical protein
MDHLRLLKHAQQLMMRDGRAPSAYLINTELYDFLYNNRFFDRQIPSGNGLHGPPKLFGRTVISEDRIADDVIYLIDAEGLEIMAQDIQYGVPPRESLGINDEADPKIIRHPFPTPDGYVTPPAIEWLDDLDDV